MPVAEFLQIIIGITLKQNFSKAVDSQSCKHPNPRKTPPSAPHQASCNNKFYQTDKELH